MSSNTELPKNLALSRDVTLSDEAVELIQKYLDSFAAGMRSLDEVDITGIEPATSMSFRGLFGLKSE